ncbi:MAG: FxsA family protein [Epsilonproteobacteria bacterium]|nr:FxsA family protein [Campylobacterota bacterium]
MIYFLIYLFLEVVISVNIASKIGGVATFFELILSAALGFFLLSNSRYTVFESMRSLANGEITIEEFNKLNLFSMLGAILLILPGFFSDILGILLQFSFFGTLFAKKILHLKSRKKRDDFTPNEEIEVIDVEIIEEKDRL